MIKRRPSPRPLGEKQQTDDSVLERARLECTFADRLYDILLEFQRRGEIVRKIKSAAAGPIGDLNMIHTGLYNVIWDAAFNVVSGGQRNKTSTRINQSRTKGQHEPDTLFTDTGQ